MSSEIRRGNWLERHLVLVAIRVFRRLRPRVGSVLMLTDKLCVKYSWATDLAEAQSMRFIAESTSVPVPRVYLAFRHKKRVYILMERINGHMLANGWVRRPKASQDQILASLKAMISEMRQLQAPADPICAVNGGSLFDTRLPGTTLRFGPFNNVQDFHVHLRGGLTSQDKETYNPDVRRLLELQNRNWDSPVFTHGDLSSLNILVRGDKVVGIVDWETAGWYPAYWEYTTACQVNPRNLFWREYIDKFLTPDPDALEMETIRRRYFGDF